MPSHCGIEGNLGAEDKRDETKVNLNTDDAQTMQSTRQLPSSI